MDEMKHDNLEKLIRSRLLDDSPAANNWNVPSDDVFHQAMRHVPEEKKRNRPILFILPIILGLGLLGFFIFFTNQKIDRLNTELSELKEDKYSTQNASSIAINKNEEKNLPEKTDEVAESKTPAISPKEALEYNRRVIQANISNKPIQSSSITTAKIAHTATRKNTKFNTVIEKKNSGYSTTQKPDSPSFTSDENGTLKSDEKHHQNSMAPLQDENITSGEKIELFHLAVLPMKLLPITQTAIEKTIELPIAPSKSKVTKSIGVYAYAGANATALAMRNRSNTSFSLTGYDKNYWGFQAGLGTKYELSDRLSLHADVNYSRYQNDSYYQDQMFYDKSNERNNTDGTTDYVTTVVIESPMHRMEEEASFRIDNQNMQQDDILDNKTEINQRFSSLGLSIGADYTIARIQNFNVYLGAGVRNQYVFNMQENMEMKIYHQGKMMMNESKNSTSMNDLNRYLISAYGSIGLSYDFNDRLSLNVLSGYEHTFNSIRTINTPSDPSTYLQSLKLSIGLKYRL